MLRPVKSGCSRSRPGVQDRDSHPGADGAVRGDPQRLQAPGGLVGVLVGWPVVGAGVTLPRFEPSRQVIHAVAVALQILRRGQHVIDQLRHDGEHGDAGVLRRSAQRAALRGVGRDDGHAQLGEDRGVGPGDLVHVKSLLTEVAGGDHRAQSGDVGEHRTGVGISGKHHDIPAGGRCGALRHPGPGPCRVGRVLMDHAALPRPSRDLRLGSPVSSTPSVRAGEVHGAPPSVWRWVAQR